MEPLSTEVGIRCCLCSYHASLDCQYSLIPACIMDDFIEASGSKNLVCNSLEVIYKMLNDVLRGECRKINVNDPKIINIRRALREV
jgi:hypothetical protein